MVKLIPDTEDDDELLSRFRYKGIPLVEANEDTLHELNYEKGNLIRDIAQRRETLSDANIPASFKRIKRLKQDSIRDFDKLLADIKADKEEIDRKIEEILQTHAGYLLEQLEDLKTYEKEIKEQKKDLLDTFSIATAKLSTYESEMQESISSMQEQIHNIDSITAALKRKFSRHNNESELNDN